LSKYGGNSNQIETEIILIYDNKDIYSNIHLSSYLPIYFNICQRFFSTDKKQQKYEYYRFLPSIKHY
jgi:hypothetical protein